MLETHREDAGARGVTDGLFLGAFVHSVKKTYALLIGSCALPAILLFAAGYFAHAGYSLVAAMFIVFGLSGMAWFGVLVFLFEDLL